MLPLKDTNRKGGLPIITITLIIINLAIWIYEYSLDEVAFQILIKEFGLIPTQIFENPKIVITHMFLHGSWLHIISNMWTLWIFGDNVETHMGRLKFIIFYFLGGIGAAVLQILISIVFGGRQVPMVGASGAISSILAAYMIFFPRARILTLVPLLFFITFANIPAVIFIGLWFLSQIINGIITLPFAGFGGVAWWAHVGGFISGYYLARKFAPPPRRIRIISARFL